MSEQLQMSSEVLLADLRNKLSPIKNYFEMLEVLLEQVNLSIIYNSIKNERDELLKIIEVERLQCLVNLPKIEDIIKQLEE